MENYDDIINLPHHVSSKRPQMAQKDRAAQFAPFAALTGYDDEIKETARLTDAKIELDEDKQRVLNEKQNFLAEHIKEMPEVTVVYFVPDSRKSGGAYISYTGNLRRIDEYERMLVFEDKTVIPIDDVYDIQSEILPLDAEDF